MRVYAVASTASGGRPKHGLDRTRYPHVLIPYSPPVKGRSVKWGYKPDDLFLDSGAYVAWSQGQRIEVARYGDWACHLHDWQPGSLVANLDIIPGSRDRPPTSREREEAVEAGMGNADYLRALGLPVIEVYHRGEPLTVLAQLCDRRTADGYLAFGGLVGGRDVAAKTQFCEEAFTYLEGRYGRDGFPRVHGFGLGPESALGVSFPWSSVDCSTWLSPHLYGSATNAAGELLSRSGRVPDPMKASDTILDRWLRLGPLVAEHWAGKGFRFA